MVYGARLYGSRGYGDSTSQSSPSTLATGPSASFVVTSSFGLTVVAAWSTTAVLGLTFTATQVYFASWVVTGGVIATELSEPMLAEDGARLVLEQESGAAGFSVNASRVFDARWKVDL